MRKQTLALTNFLVQIEMTKEKIAAEYFTKSLNNMRHLANSRPFLPFEIPTAEEVKRMLNPLFKEDPTQFKKKTNLFIPDFVKINAELINTLHKNPELMHKLHWRQFEELLSELFLAFGYETQLGPGGNDRGVDLRLIEHSEIGQILILVQAKKYAKRRKIKLEPIQALYGAIESEKANKGLFVSTSEFLPSAKKFAQENRYRINLAGPLELKKWLDKYVTET